MSIDRETFENTSEDELTELSVPDQVLGFLVAHEDRAFQAREIAAQTDLDEGAVSTALTRLKGRGLVEHKATYWAVTTDDDRLQSYSGYERATALYNERLGRESKDEWQEHAPEESHPSLEDAE
ncbi:MarR family transcriptional regulator [Halobium palmae]|uniref:MarR family transcriptional regulator n=1 Tax=Halobium palmae TaxID=1776492 RepID=A0ABD5RX65_9EURY